MEVKEFNALISTLILTNYKNTEYLKILHKMAQDKYNEEMVILFNVATNSKEQISIPPELIEFKQNITKLEAYIEVLKPGLLNTKKK